MNTRRTQRSEKSGLNVVVRVDRDPSRGVSPVIGEQIGKNRVKHRNVFFQSIPLL
jgi:hypothetical protein